MYVNTLTETITSSLSNQMSNKYYRAFQNSSPPTLSYTVFKTQNHEKQSKKRAPSSFEMCLVWMQILSMRHQCYPRVDNALMCSNVKQKRICILRKKYYGTFFDLEVKKGPFFTPRWWWGGSFRILKGLRAMFPHAFFVNS